MRSIRRPSWRNQKRRKQPEVQASTAIINKRSTDSGRFEEVSKSTAQIVKDAAALLDEELAAGIVAAKQVQRRFRKERRIDQADFSAALPRFQAVVREVITLLNDRLDDMRSPENSALVKDLVNRSHDTVDIAVGTVNSGAEVATQLANSPILRRNSEGLLKHRSPGERAGLRNFLALPRQSRKAGEVKWVYGLLVRQKSMDYARRAAAAIGGRGPAWQLFGLPIRMTASSWN